MMTREESVLILKNMLRGEVMPVYLTEQKRAAVRIALSALRPVSREQVETGYFKASGDLALCRCPFCGSENVVYERYLHTAGYRWRVVCTSCMASIDPGYAQQRSTVQQLWNTRAPILSKREMEMLHGKENP